MTQVSDAEVNRDGITLKSARRATATFALWFMGIASILGALITLSLLIVVPLFSLENEMWRRPDNPHTLANGLLYAAMGAAAILAARSSDRVRFWMGVAAFVAFAIYGLYDLGLFGG